MAEVFPNQTRNFQRNRPHNCAPHNAPPPSANNRIRTVSLATGASATLAGSGSDRSLNAWGTNAMLRSPQGIAVNPVTGLLVVTETGGNRIRTIVPSTGAVSTLAGAGSAAFFDSPIGSLAFFNSPLGVAVDPEGK